MSLQQQFNPVELAARHPLIDSRYNNAALWDDKDGDLDPLGATYVFAKSARVLGAESFTQTPVSGASQRPDGSWDVSILKGEINAEQIVVCGGLWARDLGHMGGLHLPVQPMEHHYLITDDIPAIGEAGIKNIINAPFTFGLGVNPMIGPCSTSTITGLPLA